MSGRCRQPCRASPCSARKRLAWRLDRSPSIPPLRRVVVGIRAARASRPIGGIASPPLRDSFATGRARAAESLRGQRGFGHARRQRCRFSDRQRGDCATGGVRADRVGAKLPAASVDQLDARECAARSTDGRRWKAKAVHPLVRESSADGQRKLVPHRSVTRASASSCDGIKRQGRAEAKASSRCGGRPGGWGPNPIGSSLPVQRELGASNRPGRSEIERDVVVLASCSGCRGRRETPGSKLSLRGGRVV